VIAYLKSRSPLNIVMLFLATLAAMYPWIVAPSFPNFKFHHNYLQLNINSIFFNFYKNAPVAYSFSSWLIMLLGALLFNNEFNKIKLNHKIHAFPAFIFISVFLLHYNWWGLHIHYILMFIVMYIGFQTYQFATLQNPKATLFSLGVLVGISGLLWFPAHFFIVIIVSALIRFRAFSIKEYLLVWLGLLTPYYLLLSLLFINNKMPFAKGFLPKLTWFQIPETMKHVEWIVNWVFIFLVMFGGIMVMLANFNKFVMQVRTTWGLTVFYFALIITCIFFSFYDAHLLGLILIMPITLIQCIFYSVPKNNRWIQIIWFITIALIVYNSLHYK
jgi:hypothetical protein